MGKVPGERFDHTSTNLITSLFVTNASIANLWKMDILGIKDPIESKSRKEMEAAAVDYLAKLFHETKLAVMRDIAEKRLISTSLKLIREEKYNDHNAVFKDWEESGIIEVVPEEEHQRLSIYLPHRAVIRENSPTKIRPVFDASCHVKGHLSPNDCLEKGPNLLQEIPPTLRRFHKDTIGVVSDIRKAFLQISVSNEDSDSLHFLWWEDFEKRQIMVFRVVFERTCSPFLLAVALNNLIDCWFVNSWNLTPCV
ncbi:uncharacterized protein [Parasteatoda tepidariorum]|uniref:uncharacterized protein n=1 Tax=Parasteatoda tepidariorum TaxID=114398 RepID=UPI001C71DA33|nr:uncharacterized protein LOC122268886 [Parasteatoda tepidariorum]